MHFIRYTIEHISFTRHLMLKVCTMYIYIGFLIEILFKFYTVIEKNIIKINQAIHGILIN